MIPTTLEETVPALDAMLTQEDRIMLQRSSNTSAIIGALHHSLGRHLRNKWGLWRGSPLAEHLRERFGRVLLHPDDMSHAILENYARAWLTSRHQRLVEGQQDPFKDEAL